MPLFLRKQSKQARLTGSSAQWSDDDYAVVEDQVIGRIYRVIGGPQGGHWLWFLNSQTFGEAGRSGIILRGRAPSLDAAKAALRVQYERWKARR
jgi:hypothetical protein